MKHTDEEIMDAMEHCVKNLCHCRKCPCFVKGNDTCHEELYDEILSLINRLKAEVERLTLSEREAYNQLEKGNARMNAIIEAEIKEFADKLREDRVSNDPVVIAVNAELNMRGADNE